MAAPYRRGWIAQLARRVRPVYIVLVLGGAVALTELKTLMAELKTDMAELKTGMAELKTDMAELKTDMKAGFEALSQKINKRRLCEATSHTSTRHRSDGTPPMRRRRSSSPTPRRPPYHCHLPAR